MAHPRIRNYPFYSDYERQPNEFRPFVMYVNSPGFRSPTLNTDAYGMRRQFDHAGRPIDLAVAATEYESADLLIGNSTAFGVGASRDDKTINHHLSTAAAPCLNFSIRGATSQQELYLYLALQRHLPKLNNIILFSGIINVSLAVTKAALFYPEYGAAFSEKDNFRVFYNQYERFHSEKTQRIFASVDEAVRRWYRVNRYFRWIVNRTFGKVADTVGLAQDFDLSEKREIMMRTMCSDLDVWGTLQRGSGTKVHYVLQPVINWTRKRLTSLERAIFKADCRRIPSTLEYANEEVYRDVRDRTEAACLRNGIEFHDANEWFNDAGLAKMDLFTDVCHLSDTGYRFIAEQMRARLAWQPVAGSVRQAKAA